MAAESPSSLSGWLFADLFLLLIAVGFSALTASGADDRPVVRTEEASALRSGSAVLNGWVDPRDRSVDVYFELGRDPLLADSRRVAADLAGVDIGEQTYFAARVFELERGATYFFRAVASGPAGTSKGRVLSFLTGTEGVCSDTGARLLDKPFERISVDESYLPRLVADLEAFSRENQLVEPKVAVALVSGWTSDPRKKEGFANAKQFFTEVRAVDAEGRFFNEMTYLKDQQNDELKRGSFNLLFFLVDLVDKC